MKQGERYAIERQLEAKWMKKEVLRKKKMLDAKNEYGSTLTSICVCVIGLRTRKACPNYEAVWARTDVLL